MSQARTVRLPWLMIAWILACAGVVSDAMAQDVVVIPPRPIDRKFPTTFCPLEFAMQFSAPNQPVTIRFQAFSTTAGTWVSQGIDNISVVPYTTYEANSGQCPACTAYEGNPDPIPVTGLYFNRPGVGTPFLELFQTDPSARCWDLSQGAFWDMGHSAPNDPEHGTSGSPPLGYLRLGDASYTSADTARTSVVVSGLTPGTTYVLQGWWKAENVGTRLVVSADTKHPTSGQWPASSNIEKVVFEGESSERRSIPDGRGGAWLTFVDWNSGGPLLIRARHVNANGVLDPLITVASGIDETPIGHQVVPDGVGGFIVLWREAWTFRAQRWDSGGGYRWGYGGIVIASMPSDDPDSEAVLASDGQGGALISWFTGGPDNVRAQRLDASGAKRWGADGALVSDSSLDAHSQVVSDGSGGAYVAWVGWPDGYGAGLFAQRFSGAGTALWPSPGVLVCGGPFAYDIRSVVAMPDGAGGMILAWSDPRTPGNNDIYGQRIAPTGQALWPFNGVEISGFSAPAAIVSDGAMGAIVAWGDPNVEAQSITSAGTRRWGINGQLVHPEARPVSVLGDSAGGAFFGTAYGTASHAKRLGVDANALWATPISQESANEAPCLVPDGRGGIIAFGGRDCCGDNFAWVKRLDAWGNFGAPEPHVTAIQDVPDDEGGQLSVRWLSGQFDWAGAPSVTEYRIWRQEGNAPKVLVATVPASRACSYLTTVQTTSDAVVGQPPPWTRFWIEARDPVREQWWISDVDSAYSEDNRPPPTPAGFVATYVPEGGGYDACWDPSPSPDVREYRIHLGASLDFIPGPANLVKVSQGPCDNIPGPNGSHLKLCAVDSAGNVSGYANPGTAVSVGEPERPRTLSLGPVAPNPSRDRAVVEFALPTSGAIDLAVFDLSGRRVRSLRAGPIEAGTHRATWDMRDEQGQAIPSAIYFVRLRAGSQTLRRILVKLD